MRRMTTGGVHRHERLPADLCVISPHSTVKGKAAVRPTLVSIALPHAEQRPASGWRSGIRVPSIPQGIGQRDAQLKRVTPTTTRPERRGNGASLNAGSPSAPLASDGDPPTRLTHLPNRKVAGILSTMESNPGLQNPGDPRSELAVAEQARQGLAAGRRLPTGLHPVLAGAVAVQVGAAAYGIAAQTTAGLAVALAGVAVLMGVAALLLYRFRRINGVRVDGLSSQIVLGTGGTSTLIYLGGFGAATWAAFESRWWLVAAAAVAAGLGYAFGTLRWWHAYRHDPAAHAGGVSS